MILFECIHCDNLIHLACTGRQVDYIVYYILRILINIQDHQDYYSKLFLGLKIGQNFGFHVEISGFEGENFDFSDMVINRPGYDPC